MLNTVQAHARKAAPASGVDASGLLLSAYARMRSPCLVLLEAAAAIETKTSPRAVKLIPHSWLLVGSLLARTVELSNLTVGPLLLPAGLHWPGHTAMAMAAVLAQHTKPKAV